MTQPNAFQRVAIPLLLQEDALIVRTAAGTGKTVSIGLSLAARLYALISKGQENAPQEMEGINNQKDMEEPPVVVLTSSPQRVQCIFKAMQMFTQPMHWKGCALEQGADAQWPQSTAGSKGYDFIVATPDSVKTLLDKKLLCLESLCCIFLDEADQMIAQKMDFPLEAIFQGIPHRTARFVFAKNYSFALQEFLRRHFPQKILRLEVGHNASESHSAPYTHQFVVTQNEHEKVQFITKLLNEGVISRKNRTIIFTNERTAIKELFHRLSVVTPAFKVCVRSLSTDMSVSMRADSVAFIGKGHGKILVAADPPLKSIESPVNFILNYDLPPDGIYGFEKRCSYSGKNGTVYTLIDKLTKPVIIEDIIDFLQRTNQPVPDALKTLLNTNAHLTSTQVSSERKIGTQSTFDWIRQAAKEEEKKEVKTFVRAKFHRSQSRNVFMTTAAPRNKGKPLPSIQF
ncbi:ATP-dependent RNA helicase RhlE [Perkinsela sp. CCAP 1560/4]|nr:ATP-dependent RNA helicase RhlE [Perkinsela sp. CCAP 1560/4]|eukprot:KNH09639.1 ATP-dependent RNA helicase RhlE [Perkinsela sp. CCAP 1560/4]